jgi:hypothetical protein
MKCFSAHTFFCQKHTSLDFTILIIGNSSGGLPSDFSPLRGSLDFDVDEDGGLSRHPHPHQNSLMKRLWR